MTKRKKCKRRNKVRKKRKKHIRRMIKGSKRRDQEVFRTRKEVYERKGKKRKR